MKNDLTEQSSGGLQPSAWRVEKWSGGSGYRAGFYLAKTNGLRTEWLKSPSGRAKRFATEDAAIAAATGAA